MKSGGPQTKTEAQRRVLASWKLRSRTGGQHADVMPVTPFDIFLWKVKLEARNRAPEVSLWNPLYSVDFGQFFVKRPGTSITFPATKLMTTRQEAKGKE